MDFGEILKKERERADWTQAELSEKTGWSRSKVSMLEIGQRKPSFEDVELIADLFNVGEDYLRGKTDVRRSVWLDEFGNVFEPTYYYNDETAKLAEEAASRCNSTTS